jgi:hypothetical protein
VASRSDDGWGKGEIPRFAFDDKKTIPNIEVFLLGMKRQKARLSGRRAIF